jgi:membrane-associated protein
MDHVSEWIALLASSPFALLAMALLLVVDGFFPFVPGETAVSALAALGTTGNGPAPWLVFAIAVCATMVGDGIAFLIGRRIASRKFGWMQRPRVAAAFAWAAGGLARRPALFLIAAKFVPFARVAVTMTAAAGGLSIRRYLPVSLAASVIYTAYHVLIAMVAGTIFSDNPLLAVLIAIVSVVVLGLVVEAVHRRRTRTRRPA